MKGMIKPYPTSSRLRLFVFRVLKTVVIAIASAVSYPALAQSGSEIYATYCAGCHGASLQGTAAGSSLMSSALKHGADKVSIIRSISNGIPSTTMVSWSGALSVEEIEAVAEYILEAQASPPGSTTEKPSVVDSKLYKLKIEEVVTTGLSGPWGIEFVNADRALITGKNGDLYWMADGRIDDQKITGLPKTYAYNLVGGMMDLALDPDYDRNGWIYIGLSHNPANSTDSLTAGMTKVVRGKIRNNQWVEEETLFQVPDSLLVTGGMRWGCRLLFDKAGFLYFTIGDMQGAKQSGNNPQMATRAEGKIFRIHSDGSIPKDNPFYGRKDALEAIYSWGTRNVQGLAQHPVTGQIYFTDHGPKGGDELNLLKKGGNYGWPVITYGVNYDGSLVSKETHKEGMEQPMTYWTPSIAVCAAEFVTGSKFPEWENNLLVTALKSGEIRRLVIDGDKVIEQEVLLKGYGRVRDVKIGPDGALYVLTNSPDAVLRVTPQ